MLSWGHWDLLFVNHKHFVPWCAAGESNVPELSMCGLRHHQASITKTFRKVETQTRVAWERERKPNGGADHPDQLNFTCKIALTSGERSWPCAVTFAYCPASEH